jgi:phosphatidylglycerophosphate synthase
MLDCYTVKIIRWPVNALSAWLDKQGVSANHITITGFAIGLLALPAIVLQLYWWALVFILVNRIFDGLDGAVARRQGISDCGGFLDITLDFLFYSLIPFAFVLSSPEENAVAGAFLIFSFIGTGSSFLSFAVKASKRNIQSPVYTQKSLYYIGGLMEGTETIACFVLFCLFPEQFATIAWIFGSLCWVTTMTRIWAGYHTLKN